MKNCFFFFSIPIQNKQIIGNIALINSLSLHSHSSVVRMKFAEMNE